MLEIQLLFNFNVLITFVVYVFIFQHGQQWQPDPCTTCDCDNGVTHCQTQQCNNALWCPKGFTLQFDDSECCPRCVESMNTNFTSCT